MPSERVQRRIESLLRRAEAATDREDWESVDEAVRMALQLDPRNGDARAYRAMLDRLPLHQRATHRLDDALELHQANARLRPSDRTPTPKMPMLNVRLKSK